jgi:fibronectin-binding autotransporter adhesin
VDGSGTLTINSGALMVTTTSAAASNGGTGGNYGGLFQNDATIGASGLTLGFGSAEAIITTVGTSTLTIASTSGGITGTGGLTKSGAGTLNLNAANVVSGTTTINAGSVVLGHANALQNSTLNYNNQGGSLSFGTLTAATMGSLKGAQNLALANTTPAAVALTVGNNNATNDTYSGVLSGSGSLTKIGTGTQTLAGVNTYTGATAVNNGTLALASTGSLASTVYTIGNGGTFNASAKSTYSLASVATTFDVGATTAGFFNGPSGALTFGNTLTLNFLTASIANGQTYNLLDFGSQTGDFGSVLLTGSVVGSLLLTSTDTWTGSNIGGYDITFNEDTGTLLMNVSAIPEPATYTALFGTAALVCSVIRRRHTKTAV